MKALILAAGFGTRLERDIVADTTGVYSHLRGCSKALVPIAGKPLIDYWMEQIEACQGTFDEVYVVTNAVHYPQFEIWAVLRGFPLENVLNNGVWDNKHRNGAIADIAYTLQHKKINDDLLIVAGDLLLRPDFLLEDAVTTFLASHSNMVARYTVRDDWVNKTGILLLDGSGFVQNFLEKPQPHEVISREGCPPIYFYKKSALKYIDTFLLRMQDQIVEQRDSPGQLVPWLLENGQRIYSYSLSGRFDVGNITDYVQTDTFFRGLLP